MSKTDIDNACDELSRDHQHGETWSGVIFFIVLAGIGVSVTVLPTTLAAFVSIVLAIVGMGRAYFNGRMDQEFDAHLADLRRMLTVEGAGSAESARDNEH